MCGYASGMASSATFPPFADSRWAISSATDQGVRTWWLQFPDGIDMKFGHIFDPFQRLVEASNALRLRSVGRKIRFNVLDRLKEIDDAATPTVCQKNQRLSSTLLQQDKCGEPRCGGLLQKRSQR